MTFSKKIAVAFFVLICCAALIPSCSGEAKNVVVRPHEIDSTLFNPGRGFTSTGRSFNENLGNKLHPLCGISQQRFYWDELEPEEGKINYLLLDSAIAKCVRSGQLLNFRVMCQNEDMRVPQWALEAGVKSPFYDNPVFIEKQINLIKSLGKYYDGNPNVCFVDIGTIGQWGEWHIDPEAKDPGKILYPSEATVKKIVDAYFAAFTKTPLVALIAFETKYGFEYATSNGSGWRADCWGDMDSLGWNHMKGVYPQALDRAKAHESWKNGPVALETCWTMEEWYKRGWDLDYILNKALEWHTTGVNNGTQAIPEAWYPKVKEFEKKLGYRLVLNELDYPSVIAKTDSVKFAITWNNKGVAPLYYDYNLSVQLVSKSDSSQKILIVTNADLGKLYPGTTVQEVKFKLPPHIKEGGYDLDIAVTAPVTNKPVVRLAIAGVSTEGWYRMGTITVEE